MKVIFGIQRSPTNTIGIVSLLLLLVSFVLPVFSQSVDSFNPSPNSGVYCTAMQTDGKILVGGAFTTIGGQNRAYIGRLNPDGMLDTNFNPGASACVDCLAVQPDGKVLVGGSFTILAGQNRLSLGRLNLDGTLDSSFNPGVGNCLCSVYCLVIQGDGKILVGGDFLKLGDQSHDKIGRLNADGTLDTTFNPSANYPVYSLALQTDGKILVAGSFTSLCGQPRNNIGRLNADGTLDTAFNPGADYGVYTLALQTDGRILVGGGFTNLAGQTRKFFGRLNPDGNLDSSFNPGANDKVYSLAVQADGKTLAAGSFTSLGGQTRFYIGRLNSDGTLDSGFNLGAGTHVTSLALQGDGNILAGGTFSMLGSVTRRGLGRIINNSHVTNSLSLDGSTLTWLRGGSAPELSNPTAEALLPVTGWNTLGAGTRIAGGWQWSGVTLPANATIRVHGNVTGGGNNGSSWVIENGTGAPSITSQPASRTNNAGSTAIFSVTTIGAAPFTYQWQKEGSNLTDGIAIKGTRNPTLTISNVLGADAGSYSVIVSNVSGCITSLVATLGVIDPLILTQPLSKTANADSSTVFSVAVLGSGPLAFQWRKDGVNLSGALESSLTLENLRSYDVGVYDVIISNNFGSVTSAVASLNINLVPDAYNSSASCTHSLALLADGRVLFGGDFNSVPGYLGRLNQDGTLDTSFGSGTGGPVYSLAVQADGKIVAGGNFFWLANQGRNRIGRFNADGTLDPNYRPFFNWSISSLTLQPDGKILAVASDLGSVARLNVDGTLDSTFSQWVNQVCCLALQPDGKVVIGGYFTSLGTQRRNYIARLNADGAMDSTFNPVANGVINCMALQADGKLLVGGRFSTLAGQKRMNVGRFNSDGTLDTNFNLEANGNVNSLELQSDGGILLGGNFTALGGQTRKYIARINGDGSLDTTFNPGMLSDVYSLALREDGGILAGGTFTNAWGQLHMYVRWLNNTSVATNRLQFDGSSITWLRGATAPEVSNPTADAFFPGIGWTNLGLGTRIAGVWRWTCPSSPTNITIRVRGVVTGGNHNGSCWTVENDSGSPEIISQPSSCTNNAGTTVSFTAPSAGASPISYQWQKGGMKLSDDSLVHGAQTSILTVSNVFGLAAGDYSVVVSNVFGCITSSVAALKVIDPLILAQPTNQISNVGELVTLNVAALATMPVYQWRKDGLSLFLPSNTSLRLTNVQPADAGAYDVIVSNSFGCVTSTVASLIVNQAVADSFDLKANSQVRCMAVQSDGEILVGGNFTNLSSQSCLSLGRIGLDGHLDAQFNSKIASLGIAGVSCLTLQPDGKIVVGGYCEKFSSYLGRLNYDGTLDTRFNPQVNNGVNCVVIQPDGKMLVGGCFDVMCGQARSCIGRLNADGSLDRTFHPSAGGGVTCISLQLDGKILVAGWFTNLCGQLRNNLGRLNADGSLDTTFNPIAVGQVNCIALQPDGKILVGGWFNALRGQKHLCIARLDPNGLPDSTFNPDPNEAVDSMVLQADGKILLAGWFTSLCGQPRSYIGRLNADGTLDNTFAPVANTYVHSLALQADGKILVGGEFTNLCGQARNFIGRLNNTVPATTQLSFDGSTVNWVREGAAQELVGASAEAWLPQIGWTNLGAGTYTAGSWCWSGLALATNTALHVRGVAAGSCQNGSSWLIDDGAGPTSIIRHPVNRTNDAGTSMTISVLVVGSGPISYQWRKGGTNLGETGKVQGVHADMFTISNVLWPDSGNYSVVVSNAYGAVTSSVAVLKVNDPIIVTQPLNQAAKLGDTVTFSVVGRGSEPLKYHWRKNGVSLPGALTPALTLSNVQTADIGLYNVVISNDFSSVTSAVVSLSANDTYNPAVNGHVYSLALEPDGRILVGGTFTTLWGQARNGFGRLNADGTLDTMFIPGVNGGVSSIVLQSDGKILVGGGFTGPGGRLNNIGRLNADGTLDATFTGTANNSVNTLVLQPDGRIVVGGYFVTLDTGSPSYIGRLNADGTVDFTFQGFADTCANTLVLQPDGKILAGGGFTRLCGQTRAFIGRLNPDGTLDATFTPDINGYVYCMALQSDGKILVGGNFTTLCGQRRCFVGRLNADGTLDTSFDPGANSSVTSFALQADGKILVGGDFTTLGNQACNYVGRLNPDGSLDTTFCLGADSYVKSVAVQADGKILVAGEFSTLGGQPRSGFGRLFNTTPATNNLSFNGKSITWLRGGSAPEVSAPTADALFPGTGWTNLGLGTQIAGGWQWSGLAFPSNTIVRVRGTAAGGYQNSSSWVIEDVTTGATVTIGQPTSPVLRGNTLNLNLSTQTGLSYLLQCKDRLDQPAWVDLQPVIGTGGALMLSDTNATSPQRYYRLKITAP